MPARRILCVITARGGSQGLPGKNLRPLGGRPLLDWTLQAAREARCLEGGRVIVSTDDPAIAQAVAESRYGGPGMAPFLRPAELATATAKQEDAVLHAMAFVDERQAYDDVMMLAPTNPFRDAAQIDRVAALFEVRSSARSCMTVVPCEHHPYFAGVLCGPRGDSMAHFGANGIGIAYRRCNRQELPRMVRICGSVCLATWDSFRAEQSFWTPRTVAVEVSRRQGWDIDTLEDWLVAEAMLAQDRAAGAG